MPWEMELEAESNDVYRAPGTAGAGTLLPTCGALFRTPAAQKGRES